MMGQAELPRPGDVVAGKFRVERVLGEGGMGVVVAATHLELGQQVALKFLLSGALANADTVARFLREARAAVQLRSEHVAHVIDVGRLPDGAPYMVMELLEGGDLGNVIAQQGCLPPAVAIDFVLQASEALAEAHALGIIHRDLKPANLFLTTRRDGSPCVKVLDFGIAKVMGSMAMEGPLTKTRAVMGSPGYMAPEQLQSARNVDARTDVWALGVILFELIARQSPFAAETFPETCVKVLTLPPPPLASPYPLPPGLEAVIDCCLSKDPAGRYPSVADLADALAPFIEGGAATAARIRRVLTGGAASAPGGTAALLVPQVSGQAPQVITPTPIPGITGPASANLAAGWPSTTLSHAAAEMAPAQGARSRWLPVAIGSGLVVGAAVVAMAVSSGRGGSGANGSGIVPARAPATHAAAAGSATDAAPAVTHAAPPDAAPRLAEPTAVPPDAAKVAPSDAAKGNRTEGRGGKGRSGDKSLYEW